MFYKNNTPIEYDIISKEISIGQSLNTVVELTNFVSYENLWFQKFGAPALNYTGKRTTLSYERADMTEDIGTVAFKFYVNNYMKNIERYPATFLTELAVIGGITVLF